MAGALQAVIFCIWFTRRSCEEFLQHALQQHTINSKVGPLQLFSLTPFNSFHLCDYAYAQVDIYVVCLINNIATTTHTRLVYMAPYSGYPRYLSAPLPVGILCRCHACQNFDTAPILSKASLADNYRPSAYRRYKHTDGSAEDQANSLPRFFCAKCSSFRPGCFAHTRQRYTEAVTSRPNSNFALFKRHINFSMPINTTTRNSPRPATIFTLNFKQASENAL